MDKGYYWGAKDDEPAFDVTSQSTIKMDKGYYVI